MSAHEQTAPSLPLIEQQRTAPVVVLGMHRSGTSALSGALTALGVCFGDESKLFKGDRWNEPGYFEHSQIVKLNDQLLRSVGSAWDSPPDSAGYATLATPGSGDLATAREILEELEKQALLTHAPWGFKDPRTALTWGFWQQTLVAPKLLLCIRSPADVAASLVARHQVSREFGMRLSAQYFEVLRRCIQGHPTKLVEYGGLVQRPRETLMEVSTWLGLAPSQEALEKAVATIKPELAHHRRPIAEETHQDADVWNKYRRLFAAAGLPEVAGRGGDGSNNPARLFAPSTLDQLDFGTLSPLPNNSSWSVVARVLPITTTRFAGLISKRSNFAVGSNQFTFWLKEGALSIESDATTRQSKLKPPLGKWSYVGAASSTDGAAMYLGTVGEVNSESYMGLATGSASDNLPLTLGQLGNNFSGLIAFVYLYSRQLADSEMRDICSGAVDAAHVPGLAFSWRASADIDQASGSQAKVMGTLLVPTDEHGSGAPRTSDNQPASEAPRPGFFTNFLSNFAWRQGARKGRR